MQQQDKSSIRWVPVACLLPRSVWITAFDMAASLSALYQLWTVPPSPLNYKKGAEMAAASHNQQYALIAKK